MNVTQLSKSQVSEMAMHLDDQVAELRSRPFDQGPYTFVWVDALTQKVRAGGRVVNVHCLVTVGVNNEGQHEVLGLGVVKLGVSDAHAELVDAIGANPSPTVFRLDGTVCRAAGRPRR